MRWTPGIDATFVDHLLIRPHTSWRGVRGAKPYFGAEDDSDDDFDDIEEDLVAIEEEMGDTFGRLYESVEYHELRPAGPGDQGALIARSGGSGYRGGRPSFGAELKVSPTQIQFSGSEFAAVALGLGFILVAIRT